MSFGRNPVGLAIAASLMAAQAATAQTAEHAAAVKAAMDKSLPRAGTCAPVSEDFMGWPAALVQRCEYSQGVAYLLDVKPETLAKWIETGCNAHESGVAACFDRMLKCSVEKSNATFVIGGNLAAERKGSVTNMFFRNGVVIAAPANGKSDPVPVAEQEKLAKTPKAAVEGLPGGGGVAFWHTMPFQFAVKAIDLGVPAEMNTPDRRQKWLEIIRAEMLAALKTDGNRFLSGWMTAHPITLRTGECADDRDP
ncbi:hypothetical protein [Methylocystis parvus]|uniref:Uncharacterized protein n=1 Tax=Methylocystis parvus TaxID=134 RepID=A0A6B8M6K4_9HYPH|nr:hypothetical protein [Methylocystis parvus]QGM96450.1 hypothetical protein F7D14_02430 [Methylocystis parvus]WBJ99702.1 hypothetical protein MMG94_17195 [Methylocystis parvus OBBP]